MLSLLRLLRCQKVVEEEKEKKKLSLEVNAKTALAVEIRKTAQEVYCICVYQQEIGNLDQKYRLSSVSATAALHFLFLHI